MDRRQDFDAFVVDRKLKPQARPTENEEVISSPKTLSGIQDLMSAVRSVEQALHEERIRNQNLRENNAQIKQTHESELQALRTKLVQAEEKVKHFETQAAPRIENEKALQLQVATLTEQSNRLRSELERHFLEKSEEKTKLRFEMQLLQNTQAYNSQRCLQLEKALEEARREGEKNRLDFELHRRDSQQREHRLKQGLDAAQGDNEKLEQRVLALNQEIRSLRSVEENSVRLKNENEDFKKQARDLKNKVEELTAQLNSERIHRTQAQKELESERREKHSLLGFMRAAELKLAEVEGFSDPVPPPAQFTPPLSPPKPPFRGFDHLSKDEAEEIVSKLILPTLHINN